jgi:hypothetical protein
MSSQYIFTITGPITWETAKAAAVARGGQLASVNDSAEDDFFRAVLNDYDRLWGPEPKQEARNGPWLGLFQPEGSPEPSGGWTWLDGTSLTFEGWHSTQPDNFIGDRYGHYWNYQGQIGWSDHINDPVDGGYGPVRSYAAEFGAGVTQLLGTPSDEFIFGGEVANVIKGGRGSDVIDGGGGDDVLTGGSGRDRFVFSSAEDADGDRITDLLTGDKLDLSAIDAKESRAGDQRFTRVDTFSGAEGQLTVSVDGNRTLVAGDTDGNGAADFTIVLNGDQTAFDGFVL